jgi:hypothetical protein
LDTLLAVQAAAGCADWQLYLADWCVVFGLLTGVLCRT